MKKGIFQLNYSDDGSMNLIQEDFEVEIMGGMDYECTYTFDKANAKKLEKCLGCTNERPLNVAIEEVFGLSLDKLSVSDYFEKNGIEYKTTTWID